jgi:hypothetical protein
MSPSFSPPLFSPPAGTSGTFPTSYASKVERICPQNQGENVYITAGSGDCLVAFAIGLKSKNPFDLLHGTNPSYGSGHALGWLQGLNDFMPSTPTISDSATTSPPGGNNWVLATNINLADADYTVGSVPPTSPPVYPSVQWSLDAHFPSLYVWVATSVASGTYPVNLNSCYNYSASTSPPVAGEWVTGRPIFDGGVNFMVCDLAGITGIAIDGAGVTAISSANPAVASPITTAATDLVIAIGLQKNANGLGLGSAVVGDASLGTTGYQRLTSGKLVGSEAHYLVEYAIQSGAGAWTPSFANPLGYETIIAAVALKHG